MIFRIASLPQQTFVPIRAFLLTHGFLTRRRPKIQRTRTMEKRASCAQSRWMILTKWKRSCGAGRRKPNSGSLPNNSFYRFMPNPWTGKGNPYSRKEVIERLQTTLRKGQPIIAAGAGTGISAKFIEKGGADLIFIYNSGRFRMSGHGSTCGLMAYGDANAIAMEIGEHEVLPVVEEVPVICGVHATDPRRRMWHWLLQVKAMGFSGVNNFPTHCIVDGQFRQVLEETGMSVKKEFEMVALARKMDLFSIVYVATPEEAVAMAQAGADAIIAHVGTTVGGSIGVTQAVVTWDDAIERTQAIIDAASRFRKDLIFLAHGGPINAPADVERILSATSAM